jgi:methylthioribose-1-phosphate isomerase
MNVNGTAYRSIWEQPDGRAIQVIDQTHLPRRFVVATLSTLDAVAHAIIQMQVRGAPLIGITAAYGLALALQVDARDTALQAAATRLAATRPTAVNLAWALQRATQALTPLRPEARAAAAWRLAGELAAADVAENAAIAQTGLTLLEQHAKRRRGEPVRVLTHCNAGWLAAVDWGTALAPIYLAHDQGLPVHVYVDETRPRNQGLLTAWELAAHGIPHTLIVDNAGGLLMQQGVIDLCVVGADRVAANGDVANKIGTYLKALAAHANGVPFYVAVPDATFDAACPSGAAIPIEARSGDEVRQVQGLDHAGDVATVNLLPSTAAVSNPAFDITPAALVTGLVTQHGVLRPQHWQDHV